MCLKARAYLSNVVTQSTINAVTICSDQTASKREGRAESASCGSCLAIETLSREDKGLTQASELIKGGWVGYLGSLKQCSCCRRPLALVYEFKSWLRLIFSKARLYMPEITPESLVTSDDTTV